MALEPVVAALHVVHKDDPRELIWQDMGLRPGGVLDTYGKLLDMVTVGGSDVLIVRYERRADDKEDLKTHGGIILPKQVADNDKWMGNTGLIVKMGPQAYNTEKTIRWFDRAPAVGDWAFFDPHTSKGFMLGKRFCFLVPSQYVFLLLERPDIVQ